MQLLSTSFLKLLWHLSLAHWHLGKLLTGTPPTGWSQQLPQRPSVSIISSEPFEGSLMWTGIESWGIGSTSKGSGYNLTTQDMCLLRDIWVS